MSRRNPTRLVVALSVAAVLAVFLLYTSFAGGATPALEPSELRGHAGPVNLAGKVVGPVAGQARGAGLTFGLVDVDRRSRSVRVRYRGAVPDLFRVGRHVFLRGRLVGAVFEAEPGSLVTKCPSRYEPKPGA